MPPDPIDSVFLRETYQRLRAGDRTARDQLLVRIQDRVERMARRMLRSFPVVHRWEETLDVTQAAMLKLVRALDDVQPPGERAFFGLAAEQIRRVLLDLARRYQGPHGPARHHASVAIAADSSLASCDPPAREESPEELERWCAFHEAIERLPAEEREVVGLAYYHGWTQVEIARLLEVSERTVRRYWLAGCGRLGEWLQGDFPLA